MKKRRELLGRLGLGFFGIILVLMGLSSIHKGELNYENYWGGVVFAPVAIIMGILVLIIVIFRWKAMNQMSKNENPSNHKTNKHDNWHKW